MVPLTRTLAATARTSKEAGPFGVMTTDIRMPPRPCYDGCKGWDIFNADGVLEIQRCDECWAGVPDAPTDSDYQALPECQAELPEECEDNDCAGCAWCDLLTRTSAVDVAIRGVNPR
jgi:hypothetical protein